MDKKRREEDNESPNSTDIVKNKLSDCEKKRDEYLDGWKRAKADFINYKKEEFRRLEELVKYGSEDLISDLLGTLDGFDLAIEAMEKAGGAEKGIYMIRSQLTEVLRKRGLEKIKIAAGDNFDPAAAEAVAEAESDKPAGTIIEEIEAGYRLHEKILRPAKVKIAKSKS